MFGCKKLQSIIHQKILPTCKEIKFVETLLENSRRNHVQGLHPTNIWDQHTVSGWKLLITKTTPKIGSYYKIYLVFFKKMGQSWSLLMYFRPFLITISILQIEKSLDGLLGIQPRGCRIVGADKTTELRRPPKST